MKRIKMLKMLLVALPAVVVLSLAPSIASATTGFVDGPEGHVKTDYGECLHTARWDPSTGTCGVIDKDGDGVNDDKDACPDTPKGVVVDKGGCAVDSDGDGFADHEDDCPDTPKGVEIDSHGCHESEVSKITITVSNVHFDFDRATLKDSATEILDTAAEQVNRHAAAVKRVVVTGHADSTGPEAYNQALSERRADAVKVYLEGKGVRNITAEGAGENDPTADNGTRAGRASNRRVEIDIRM